MAPGCKPGGFTPYVGSNPTPCTSTNDERGMMNERLFCLSFIIPHSSFIVSVGGSSSVGRASAFQAEGREFEPRLPLQTSTSTGVSKRPSSSGVERLLGKEEVM